MRSKSYTGSPGTSREIPGDDTARTSDLWLSPAMVAEEGTDASAWGAWADDWRYELGAGGAA